MDILTPGKQKCFSFWGT